METAAGSQAAEQTPLDADQIWVHNAANPQTPRIHDWKCEHSIRASTVVTASVLLQGMSHRYPDRSSFKSRMYSFCLEDGPIYRKSVWSSSFGSSACRVFPHGRGVLSPPSILTQFKRCGRKSGHRRRGFPNQTSKIWFRELFGFRCGLRVLYVRRCIL
jgi:hypothetical protein